MHSRITRKSKKFTTPTPLNFACNLSSSSRAIRRASHCQPMLQQRGGARPMVT
jgi:hypothetical protein